MERRRGPLLGVVVALVALAVGMTVGAALLAPRLPAIALAVREHTAGAGIATPLLAITGSAALTMLFVPRAAVALLAGAAYGALPGALYVLIGAALAGLAMFAVGRRLGPEAVVELAGRWGPRLDRWLTRRSVRAVALSRIAPFLSYSLLSYGFGGTSIRLRAYLSGTLLGIAPSTICYSATGSWARTGALAAVAAVVVLMVAPWLVHRIRRGAGASAGAGP